MADRKRFFGNIKIDSELIQLLEMAANKTVSDADLREQRISFAFGNAPAANANITKESIRYAAEHILLRS